MDFKEAYKFPLVINSIYSIKVFTQNNITAFDFMHETGFFNADKKIILTDQLRKQIVDIINGDSNASVDGNIEYNEDYQTITVNDKILLSVRGWGYLTGSGGLNLDASSASKIMDDFGLYIKERLKKKS